MLQETRSNWEVVLQPGDVVVPERRCIFRAFKKIRPDQVRVVLLGQDPYPNPRWATGRAFEQGDLTKWPENPSQVADSLRRLILAMAAARTGDVTYTSGDRAWRALIRNERLETPRAWFDRLEREGVLLLNASLTAGHFAIWEPLIARVLSFLAARPTGHLIFLLFGRRAERIFDRSGARAAAEEAGAWQSRVGVVRHFHPAAITKAGPAFFQPPNPFTAANDLLRRMGAAPVKW